MGFTPLNPPSKSYIPIHSTIFTLHTSHFTPPTSHLQWVSTHCPHTQNAPSYSRSHRLLIINAPITPGTQPQSVKRHTITNDPQPLSITASGGKKIQTMARRIPMTSIFTSKNRRIRCENSSESTNQERNSIGLRREKKKIILLILP